MNSEIVILVHGTYAGDDADDGHLWWQRGSDFWNTLRAVLPPHIRLADNGSLFHWSGENDALERHVAGSALYEYMLELDRKAVAYHVIAHSHGGSVLWSALRLAEVVGNRHRKDTLNGLRSCTTLGTPFLIYDQPQHPIATLWMLEIVMFVLQIGLPVCVTVALWPSFGFFAIAALTLVIFTMPFAEVRSFPVKFSAMQRYDSSIAKKYRSRWLSIYSPDDEAISALRAALRLANTKISFRPSQPIVPIQESNRLVRLLFVGHTLALFIFDKFVVPFLTRIVRRRVSASALGVRVTGRIQKIDPYPCDELGEQIPIPRDVQAKLKSDADRRLSEVAPAIRETLRALGSGDVDNPLRLIHGNLRRELVHTSYLENEDVIRMVVGHIRAHSQTSG